jgi:hypothetical protein
MESDLNCGGDSIEGLTAGQLEAKRSALESGAATLLGRMLFAFGFFEQGIDFCIVWAYAGQEMQTLTKRIDGWSVDKKIEFLGKLVSEICSPGGDAHLAYVAWLAKADGIRIIRNQLAHGRWSISANADEVVNYCGIAGSLERRESRYTLLGLEKFIQTIEQHQRVLHTLRSRFPL